MFASMVISYSLLLINYTASVVFTSSFVLLMFHLLAPGSLRLIGERAIDTVVGSAIAIAASHLFPYWEYRLMGKLVNDMIAAMRNYLEASGWGHAKASAGAKAAKTATDIARAQAKGEAVANQVLAEAGSGAALFADSNARAAVASTPEAQSGDLAVAAPSKETAGDAEPAPALKSANATAAKLSSVAVGESTAAATGAGASAAATVAATALDRNYRYRLARKNVHVAFANLAQAFQRMMLEPKAQQKFVAELNDLLVQSHVLASQITAAAPLLQSLANVEGYAIAPVERTLAVIREDLVEAQAGAAPSEDHGERMKELTRGLDSMVVAAERANEIPGDVVHDLKLLAHQCKQMLAASMLIRKDASVIRLPA
jgi:uncharacterized membrane protein YccC